MGLLSAQYGADPDLRLVGCAAALAVLALGTSACGVAVVIGRSPARTSAALAWLAPVLAIGGLVHGFMRAAGGAGSPLSLGRRLGRPAFVVTLFAAAVHVAARSAALGMVRSS